MTTPTPEEARESVRRYVSMRAAKPLRGMDDTIHGIHAGTEWEAKITLSHLSALLAENERLVGEAERLNAELAIVPFEVDRDQLIDRAEAAEAKVDELTEAAESLNSAIDRMWNDGPCRVEEGRLAARHMDAISNAQAALRQALHKQEGW